MKKVLSLFLAFVLMFSVSATAAASPAQICTCAHPPVIYITGFAMTDLVAYPGTENQYNVFMPETEKIQTALKQLIAPIVQVMLLHNYKSFARSLAKAAHFLLDEIACDDNGDPVNDYVDVCYRSDPSAFHNPYTQTRFRYDWREDVFDIAAELHEFIEETKRLTGHSKVVLKGESMGGAVLMTYLKVYGHDSVDTIIMQSSAFNGISLVGDLFTGDLRVQTANALRYAENYLEGSENEVNFYRLMLRRFGFLAAPIVRILDKTMSRGNSILYQECLSDLFGNIPGLWTFVPQEKYAQAKAFLLDETENAVLIQKIDRYHYGVADSTKALLDDALADGVKLAIIANYDKAAVPVGEHAGLQSDFLIDTARTSMGATCADFGKTLGEDYVQKVDDGHNHVSCDNVIDASTCAYPEYTWFVKDMMHTWYTGSYATFTYWLSSLTVQPTVHDTPLYPQFMVDNHDTNELEPLTVENSERHPTDVDWKALFQLFRERIREKR